MAKKKSTKKSNKTTNRQYQRATRNVQLENQPSIDMINAQKQQLDQDLLRQYQMASSTYGGAEDAIRGLDTPDFGGIADTLQSRIGALGGALGGGTLDVAMDPTEVAAAQTLGTTIGAGGLENLAAFEAMARNSQQGAQREAALAGRYAKDNLQQQMQDTLQGYNNALQGISSRMPAQIEQEQDQLRQQALERKLAMSQIQGDKAFSQFLQDQIGGMVGGGGGSGRSSRKRRGGNGPSGRPGNVRGDTAAGGNNFSRGDTAVGGNQGTTSVGPYGKPPQATGPIPSGWEAKPYNQLPPLLQRAYEREPGYNLRSIFANTAHPSFDNFDQFQNAYQQFLPRINKLYRRSRSAGRPGYEWNNR